MDAGEILKLTAQLGLPAALFIWLFRWVLRRVDKDEGEKADVTHSVMLLTSTILSLQQQLLLHDLTSSGIDPNKEPSSPEARMALRKYTELQASLTSQKQRVDDAAEFLMEKRRRRLRPKPDSSTETK